MCTESLRQRGLTLIELIVFIVIVGVALAGVLLVLNQTLFRSGDPLARKQALAIAEAILEEVSLQPFTWCDPDDPAAATATGYASCATPENAIAAEGGEARGNFDNVNDYHGLATSLNIAGGGSAPYQASVEILQEALNGVAADASLRITVTVTTPSESVQLQGYRLRHSPTVLP